MKVDAAKVLPWISVATYVASLFMPVFRFKDGMGSMSGGMCLAFGWTAVLYGVWGWCANPFAFGSLIYSGLKIRNVAISLAVIGFVLGLTSLVMRNRYIPLDEANVKQGHVESFGPGFYVWLLSLVLVVVTAWVRVPTPRQ
jgi:hypothetical protein